MTADVCDRFTLYWLLSSLHKIYAHINPHTPVTHFQTPTCTCTYHTSRMHCMLQRVFRSPQTPNINPYSTIAHIKWLFCVYCTSFWVPSSSQTLPAHPTHPSHISTCLSHIPHIPHTQHTHASHTLALMHMLYTSTCILHCT